MGGDIYHLKRQMASLTMSNKVLTGRLLRAETVIERQRRDISDLRMRSMRDNIIIKSKGEAYKEVTHENTAVRFQTFLKTELRVADTDKIEIPRAHRMGRASNGFNRMMIAKVPSDTDQKRIFANAKALHNTGHSISKQIPYEVEERRIFGWPMYKKARQEEKFAKFDGGRLFIDGEAVTAVDPVSLPPSSVALDGAANTMLTAVSSDEHEVEGHVFRAWAAPVSSLQNVRDGLDTALADGLATATFASYAFRFKDEDGNLRENFDSDADNGVGLSVLKYLREQRAVNVAVYILHDDITNTPISIKAKTATINNTVKEALHVLSRRWSAEGQWTCIMHTYRCICISMYICFRACTFV